ncbi:replication terminator protein [Tissierella sp. MB52-C2]|uniref:replication terminator protein n=1 Tax=Tissierella sp. MB52-C2 TaxID=3070999 RepID=UPI00280B69AD|nr:replication terminator protein [Tissierella sp. MB52-C2]WMM24071.1 replication terminator protein [Tissierella sp. MB52-C2]
MNNAINLEKFAGGALAEKFNLALKEVLENIADPNTKPETKRKLTLELTFVPSEDRELSIVGIDTKTKLAATKSVATKILIDRDGQGGIIASEYNNQLKGQQYLQVDEDTGEILSPNELEKAGIKLVK